MDPFDLSTAFLAGASVTALVTVAGFGIRVMFASFRAVADPGDPDLE